MINSLVVGLPFHHCLLKNADRNLARFRNGFDKLQARCRKIQPLERKLFDPWGYNSLILMPNFPTLNRPATADDLKAGRAVFHLDGKGKFVDIKLPLIGELETKGKEKQGERVLIVQAETNADGEVVYGVIARYSVRAMPASAFARVEAM